MFRNRLVVLRNISGHTGAGFSPPGLPDGLVSNQKSQFGENFDGHRLKNVEIF
jgi:hypothetical protein